MNNKYFSMWILSDTVYVIGYERVRSFSLIVEHLRVIRILLNKINFLVRHAVIRDKPFRIFKTKSVIVVVPT